MAKRLLVAIVLVLGVAYLSQFGECRLCMPGLCKSKTAEEKAYKRLFKSSAELSRDEALELLKIVSHYHHKPIPINVHVLLAYDEVDSAKCKDRSYIEGMDHMVKMVELKCPAIKKYLQDTFKLQMDACANENPFKSAVEQFQTEEQEKWQLIERFGAMVMQDCPVCRTVPSERINEVLQTKFNGTSTENIPKEAFRMILDLRNACKLYVRRIDPGWLMPVAENTLAESRHETAKWLQYLRVCKVMMDTDSMKAYLALTKRHV